MILHSACTEGDGASRQPAATVALTRSAPGRALTDGGAARLAGADLQPEDILAIVDGRAR